MNLNNELGNRLVSIVESFNPISNNGYKVNFNNISVTIPEENFDLENQLNMKSSKKGNTEGYIEANIALTDSANTSIYNQKFKKLIVFPIKTERGTYIVNGIEKNLVSQMKMKPGVYTSESKGVTTTQLRFARNNNLSFMPAMKLQLDIPNLKFDVIVRAFNKDNVYNIVNFMTILGLTESDIKAAMGNSELAESINKKYSKNKFTKTTDSLFKLFHSGKNSSLHSEKEKQLMIQEFMAKNASFGDGTTVKSTLMEDKNIPFLTKEILVKAIRKTMATAQGVMKQDVKDDLKYKDVYSAEDSIAEYVIKGMDQFKIDIESKLANFDRTKKPAYLFSTLSKTLSDSAFSSKGIMNSDLAGVPEEINPLFMESKQREITQAGEGGLSTDTLRKEVNARNLTTSGINKIDPIETPESGKIGIIQHLTANSKIRNKTIYIKVYKVFAGKAKATEANTIELDPLTEEESVIAFNDSRYVNLDGDTIVFTEAVAPCRYKGEVKDFPISQIKFVDTASNNLLGTTTNSIPFVSNDDGARVLMGASMQKQAINLVNREAPLVTTIADEKTGQTSDQKLGEEHGKPVISLVDGKVKDITSSKILVEDSNGAIHPHQYYNYFPLNQSYINNELKVKVGDTVQKGQMLAEGWQTKDGKLALGANARIGYMPFHGYNYEDGIVISKSFAEKMTSNDLHTIEIEIPKGAKGGRGSSVKNTLRENSLNASIDLLDNDGIAKVGDYVKAGSVLVGFMKEISKTSDDLLDIIAAGKGKTTNSFRYSEKQIQGGSYVEGKIVRINVVNSPDSATKQKLIFNIRSQKPLKEGDKIAGRHGNKGTISLILPDEEMPIAEDGKVIDVAMSPLAVPSRKNLGQLFEAGAGLVAEKTGKQFVVKNFDHKEKERVFEELKKIGVPDGKMKVTLREKDRNGNIVNVPLDNKITVGNAYIMKLKHKVDDKIQGRNNNETALAAKTRMPTKAVGTASGEKSNPQRFGEMEMSALLAHGASWNTLEATTIKSDGGGDKYTKAAIFNAIATGKLDSKELDRAATPETVKVLRDTIQGFGLDVKAYFNGAEVPIDKPFSSIGLSVMNQKKFIEAVGKDKEVSNAKSIQTRQLVSSTEGDSVGAETKGGLFDPEIFGDGTKEEDRNKWGYIKLPTPIPNPMFMEGNNNIYASLLNIKTQDVKDLAGVTTKPKAVITNVKELDATLSKIQNPELRKMYKNNILEAMKENGFKEGDVVDLNVLDSLKAKGVTIPYKAGGFALEHLLSKVDIDKEMENAKIASNTLKNAKDLNKNYKKIRALENLKRNDMNPKDLMMNVVPVVPTYLRPINFDKGKNQLTVNDLDKLYQNLLSSKGNAEKEAILGVDGRIENTGLAPKDLAQRSKFIYDSVKRLQGQSPATDKAGVELASLKNTIAGKGKLIRKDMLGKRQDFSGRSVITINPNLALDEVAIPLDMARSMYKPFAIKKMISDGVATEREAYAKFDKMDSDARKALQFVANDRPVTLNRAPTLHKYGVMAFKPVIKEKDRGSLLRSIQLNPLTVTAFNADFDGDTMSSHVPISDFAKEEAKKLLSPVENLINATNASMVVEIRHEMALGIFQLTKTWKNPSAKAPKQYKLYKDLFEDYRLGKIKANDNVVVPIAMKPVTTGQALFNWCIPEKVKHLRDFNKDWGSKEIKKMMKKLYEEAEINNFSKLSKMDIVNVMNKMKTIGFQASTRDAISVGISDFKLSSSADKKIKKIMNSANLNHNEWEKVEKEIEKELSNGLLDENNSLQIMMKSGARANPQQIRKMFATIGTGRDVTLAPITPLKGSHFSSLSPSEFYNLNKDSRKGMYDRSVSTSAPGALTREILGATQNVTIITADCKTKDYISILKTDGSLKGRFAAKNIVTEKGEVVCKKNQLITVPMIDKILADDTIKYIQVRSVSRCSAVNGKCQKCYGAMPGTMEVVKLGAAIGIIAAQAVGEPSTQMTMNTFHTGGANSSATMGLPALKNILSLKTNIDGAIVAKATGTIDKIEDLANSINITIAGKVHKVPKNYLGQAAKIKVKEGDKVEAGDFLTLGDTKDILEYSSNDSEVIEFTGIKPKDLFDAKVKSKKVTDALGETRDYIETNMSKALNDSKAYMDRRHTEVIVSKLTGSATVIRSGDSPYTPGQIADVNLFEKWNRENMDKNQIEYQVNFNGRNSIKDPNNWVENISNVNVMDNLGAGAMTGAVDNITAPKSRQMLGKMQKMDSMNSVSDNAVNSVNNKMRNFFETKKVNEWLEKNKKKV